MRTLKLNRKGVSPIIATLLLIVIAVAAAVVTYSFVMGFIEGTGSTNPTTGTITVDEYNIDAKDIMTLYIRNVGNKAVNLSAIYVNGTTVSFNTIPPSTGNSLPIGKVTGFKTVAITSACPTLDTGAAFSVKIVCTDGTEYPFYAHA